MKKLCSAAALAFAAVSSPVSAISEGEYYYLPSDLCETASTENVSQNKLLTVIGNNSQSQVQLNLELLADYPETGLSYLEQAQNAAQIAIVEKASKNWVHFTQDNMYILGKEKIPLSEAAKIPAILANSPEKAEAYLSKIESLAKRYNLKDDDIIIVQTGARVLVQDDTNEVFLKSFFTAFDARRVEKHLLTIDHHAPMMQSLEVAFHEKRSHGACGVKTQDVAKL